MHFAEQLRRQGWTAGERAETASLIAQAWSHTDSTGTAWTGVFLINAPASTSSRDLIFPITRR